MLFVIDRIYMNKIKIIFLLFVGATIVFIALNYQSLCLRFSYRENNDFNNVGMGFKPVPTTATPQKNNFQHQNLQTAPSEIYKDNRLVIPKIEVNAPIIFSDSASPHQIKKDLKRGVVHHPDTAPPGEKGNVFIVGHSSNYFWQAGEYDQVFALLDKLKNGNLISVFYQGKKYNYQVYEIFQVNPHETWIMNSASEPIITLMTCWPVGTNLRRLVVRGRLDANQN